MAVLNEPRSLRIGAKFIDAPVPAMKDGLRIEALAARRYPCVHRPTMPVMPQPRITKDGRLLELLREPLQPCWALTAWTKL
jgi:hypothetical protein